MKQSGGSRRFALWAVPATVAYAIALSFSGDDATSIEAIVGGLASFAFALLAADVAIVRRGRERLAWALIAIAAVGWSGSATTAAIALIIGGDEPPLLSTILSASASPLCLLAVLLLAPSHRRGASLVAETADGLLIAAATLFVAWDVVLRQLTEGALLTTRDGQVVFIAGLVTTVMVAMVIMAASRVDASDRRPIVALAAGLVAVVVPDLIASMMRVTGGDVPLAVRSVALGGFVFLGAGARTSLTRSTVDEDHLPTLRRALVPYGPAAIAALDFVISPPVDETGRELAVAVAVFFLIRQLLALVQHTSLLRELDARVLERSEQIRSATQRFAALVQRSSDVVTLLNHDGIVEYQSDAATSVFGLRAGALRGLPFLDWIHDLDRERVRSWLDTEARGVDASVHARLQAGDGTWREVEIVATNLLDDPDVRAMVLNIRDVSERNVLQRQIDHQLIYDELTGAHSRAFLVASIAETVSLDLPHGVLAIDVDQLGGVNRRLGHAAGDAVLTEVASRLLRSLRPTDIVSRLSGDEFGVLLLPGDRASVVGAIETAVTAIRSAMEEPFDLDGRSLSMTVSIGSAASADDDGERDLLAAATGALAYAKASGRGSTATWDTAYSQDEEARLTLADDLRSALRSDVGLQLEYEPTVDVATGLMLGVDAAVVWDHPQHGRLGAARVLSIAEDAGLLATLTRWTVERAASIAAAWPSGASSPMLGLRVGAGQVREAFVLGLAETLRRHELRPERLRLDVRAVTRSIDGQTIAALRQLRSYGVMVAVDDAGVLSNAVAFADVPADSLVIGAHLVTAIGLDDDAAGRVGALIDLAHASGLSVIAEGVEVEEHAALLSRRGCEMGRGGWFGRPLSHARLGELLASRLSVTG